MLEHLIRGLRGIEADFDAVALADALWLCAAMGSPDTAPGEQRPPEPAGPPAGGTPPRDPATPEEPGPAIVPYPAEEDLNAYDTPGGPGDLPAVVGRARRGTALPGAPALARALRPLKQPFPRGRELGLDIEETIALSARTEEVTPVLAPLPERWFQLDLVVDGSPSMQVWRELADDLHVLLQRLGAFRTVRRWQLRTDPDGPPALYDAAGTAVPPERLRDPHGRRLVLVLSDCVADGWHAPEIWEALRDWVRSTATVLLNPLPPTLWPHTGLDGAVVTLRARERGARSAELPFDLPDGLRILLAAAYPEALGTWLACPVAGISAADAAAWAGTLMAAGGGACEGVLIPPGGRFPDPEAEAPDPLAPEPDPEPFAPEPEPFASPELLLDAFRRVSSPAARRLAVLCSPQTELSLPVLRAVQAAMEPDSGTGAVAELVVSDLFEHVPGTETGELRLRFRPGVREALHTSLSAEDAWQVYFALSRFVEAEAAQGPGLPVAVATEAGPARIPYGLRPFAAASDAVLRLLGVAPARTSVPAEPVGADIAQGPESPPAGLWLRIQPSGVGHDAYFMETRTLPGLGLVNSRDVAGNWQMLSDAVARTLLRSWAVLPVEVESPLLVVDVPRELLSLRVEEWNDSVMDTEGRDGLPNGLLYHVVYRCANRMVTRESRQLRDLRWRDVREAGGRVIGPVGVYWAGSEPAESVRARLGSAPHVTCVVLDGPPDRRDTLYRSQLEAALAAGVPAVLWDRDGGYSARSSVDKIIFRQQVQQVLDGSGNLPASLNALHRNSWNRSGELALPVLLWNDPSLEDHVHLVPVAVHAPPRVDRSRVFAVVVGVERYVGDHSESDLDGPAHDARNITDWLLEEGVPAGNITALVSPVEANRDLTTHMGVPVREATANNVVEGLFREASGSAGADLLLVFWSGHGFTDHSGSRYLMTADGSEGLYLHLGQALGAFRSDAVPSCDRQLWFIDACAGPAVEEAEPLPALPVPTGRPVAARSQAVYVASSPGDLAAVELRRRGGLFSLELLGVFRETAPWDFADPYALHEELSRRFDELREQGRTRQAPMFQRYDPPSTAQ
ncbi:SAV_2336 N-terminal domain-related protein [Streptomyces goshikiensis]|uniref:SAV_2336 N-terminal domain-related protein n=1 Tax=Streptomyces goshikiensis TaxID=1942 RepID=UPI003721FA66